MEIRSILQTLPFWTHLTAVQQESLYSAAQLRDCRAGSLVHAGGEDPCLGMMMLLQGTARSYMMSREGREVTLFRLEPGDSCVLSAACMMQQVRFEMLFAAETDCRLLVLPSRALANVTGENIHARCWLYEKAAQRFSAVMCSMEQLLFDRFDTRLAGFLLQEADRTGSRELHVTHEQIARQVSSAREVVARQMKKFAADGLVESHRGIVRILDPRGLKNLL